MATSQPRTEEALDPTAMRVARELKGLTQAQLAERIGSHQSVVSNVERGLLDPHMSVILRICGELELRPSAFLSAPRSAEGSLQDPRPLLRWMIAYHFITHRQTGLAEVLERILVDVRSMRPDIIALTLHLFDREPMQYAGAVAGRYGVTYRELLIEPKSLRDSRGALYDGWLTHSPVRKDGEDCAMADYAPAFVVDLPTKQAMVGIGYALELPDSIAWGRILAREISRGIDMRDEVRAGGPHQATEKLDRIEERLSQLEEGVSGES